MATNTDLRDDPATRVDGPSPAVGASRAQRVEVVQRPEQNRYELRIDGEVRGLMVYVDHGPVRALVHTEVDGSLQRNGYAGQLVRRALDDIAAGGRRVNLACPYAQWFVEHHPEYAPLAG